MKTVKVTNAQSCTKTGENANKRLASFQIEGPDIMQVSDGSHTFEELYAHRVELFIALCRKCKFVWRSRRHCDDSWFDGWFIAGIGWEKEKQITYHLPNDKWEECEFMETLNNAPEWDGYMGDTVIERLKKL